MAAEIAHRLLPDRPQDSGPGSTGSSPSARWVVVVPQKRLAAAKSRMRGLPGPVRRRLVIRMAETVVATATAVPVVEQVLLLVEEDWPNEHVHVLRQRRAAGLNAALEDADRFVRSNFPGHHLAVLPADAALASEGEVSAALRYSAEHARAVMADRQGTGTVLLTRAPGELLSPRFGPNSRRLHVASGAFDVTAKVHAPGLRRDLDTIHDLRETRWASQDWVAPASEPDGVRGAASR